MRAALEEADITIGRQHRKTRGTRLPVPAIDTLSRTLNSLLDGSTKIKPATLPAPKTKPLSKGDKRLMKQYLDMTRVGDENTLRYTRSDPLVNEREDLRRDWRTRGGHFAVNPSPALRAEIENEIQSVLNRELGGALGSVSRSNAYRMPDDMEIVAMRPPVIDNSPDNSDDDQRYSRYQPPNPAELAQIENDRLMAIKLNADGTPEQSMNVDGVHSFMETRGASLGREPHIAAPSNWQNLPQPNHTQLIQNLEQTPDRDVEALIAGLGHTNLQEDEAMLSGRRTLHVLLRKIEAGNMNLNNHVTPAEGQQIVQMLNHFFMGGVTPGNEEQYQAKLHIFTSPTAFFHGFEMELQSTFGAHYAQHNTLPPVVHLLHQHIQVIKQNALTNHGQNATAFAGNWQTGAQNYRSGRGFDNVKFRRKLQFKTTGLHPLSTLRVVTKPDLFRIKRNNLPVATIDKYIIKDPKANYNNLSRYGAGCCKKCINSKLMRSSIPLIHVR